MAERLAQRLPVAGAMALLLSISCLLACTEATETQVTGTPTLEILEVRRMDTLLPGSSIRVRGRGVRARFPAGSLRPGGPGFGPGFGPGPGAGSPSCGRSPGTTR